MLSADRYATDLREFVQYYAKTNADAIFKLYETNRHPYAEQRQLVHHDPTNSTAYRLISITYNDAYSAPVLWFNFYEPSGKLLQLDDFKPFISIDFTSSEIFKGLSQNEHPIHGIAFYNIHPCKTSDFMSKITTRNYIISWLSVYGTVLGLDVSNVATHAVVI